MKILIVSWYFPPYNTMGALRVGKFAKYLHEDGHDVRVLTASNLPFEQTLPQEFPEDRVVRSGYTDVNSLPKKVSDLRRRLMGLPAEDAHVSSSAPAPGNGSAAATPPRLSPGRRMLRSLRDLYTGMLNFPDGQIGWLPHGRTAARKLLADWKPDVVFASAPPFTTLMVGRYAHRLSGGAPLVVEYRDRWIEDPYGEMSAFKRWLHARTENYAVRHAAAFVTVSEPWAKDYRARFGKPVDVVYNGFDPDEFPAEFDIVAGDPERLDIVYTGILYPERRDPSPLFEAMRRMGEEAKRIRVSFYGAHRETLLDMAARHGVTDLIEIHGRIPYREAIARQRQADILLLLQWNNPLEAGNVPGKVFEYIGSRRPVLALGYEGGVPARLLRERGAGVMINDPDAIADQLRAWLNQKREQGSLPLLPVAARSGLARPDQYKKIVELFRAQIPGGTEEDVAVSAVSTT